jgi:AraC family transcriptional regulator, regulatory protein of adaptative response / DNA-3-methyladenine glycosylase II
MSPTPASQAQPESKLDHEVCYRAVQSRDARFDGHFFTAVSSTGIYCRPICPARAPLSKNCTFYGCAAAAEAAGYRPCKRCRPETAPGTPAWRGSSATVGRAMRLINEGLLDDGGVEDLADRLGLGARHLRRLFVREVGASPLAVAQTRRAHFARKLIDETRLPMVEVALAAGFASVRRFNAAIKERFGQSPTALRRRAGLGAVAGREQVPGQGIALRLSYRAPYDWAGLLAFLGPRATPGVEQVEGLIYRRTVALGEARGVIEVTPDPGGKEALVLRVPPALSPALLQIAVRARGLLDLDADPAAIAAQLGADRLLRPLVRARPGLRVPGAWDRFELAVRAVLGQQVNVRGATTQAGRLAGTLGQPIDSGYAGLDRLFPGPARLVNAELPGMPRRRAETIRALARAVLSGELDLDAAEDLEAFTRRATQIPGVGPWTAQYIALRALRAPDAFPTGDLGLRRALEARGEPATPAALTARAEAWRPWRGYAALHLWSEEGAK